MADFTTRYAQASQVLDIALHGNNQGDSRRQYAAFLWLAQQEQGQVILRYLTELAFFSGVPTAVSILRMADGGSDPVRQAAKAEAAVEARREDIWLQEGVRWLVREILEKIRQAPAALQQEQG